MKEKPPPQKNAKLTKKQSSLQSQGPELGCKPVLPAWDRFLKQSLLAGSKCPLSVPPGTTAHGFLILLEQRFPDESHHALSIHSPYVCKMKSNTNLV